MSSSWLLPRSIANSLNAYPAVSEFPLKETEMFHNTVNSSNEAGRGVKEDLTEIKNSLARKLRGVASFLTHDAENEGLRKMDGIRSDFAEIGGKVKAGISKIIQAFPDDGGDYQATRPVGVTEELLAFVSDLVLHPRTWVRFPLPDEANANDFALNDAQQSHVGAMERHIPELGDLRLEICPEYLSEGRFWMIYFVLVHPKLDKYDALTLSSPQIVEARARMAKESKNRRKASEPAEASFVPSECNAHDGILQSIEPSKKDVMSNGASTDLKTQKPPHESRPSSDIQPPTEANGHKARHVRTMADGSSEEDDNDDWLNEETGYVNGTSTGVREMPVSNGEELAVSFSDLEEEDINGNK